MVQKEVPLTIDWQCNPEHSESVHFSQLVVYDLKIFEICYLGVLKDFKSAV